MTDNRTTELREEINAKDKRIRELESLVRDACWLIVRASWPSSELDQLASDLCERMDSEGIEG